MSSTKYVPLISSGVAGPLGVLHLPRLWLKVSLAAAGKLADGYPDIGAGYDSMVCQALNLNPDAVKSFVHDAKPTYPQFEAWVKRVPGVRLDKATIQKLNLSIVSYIHADETRKGILRANGLPDDGNPPQDAVNLNNLDDWWEFHQLVILEVGQNPALQPNPDPAEPTRSAVDPDPSPTPPRQWRDCDGSGEEQQ
jgi:hypothetical protein